MTAMISRKKAQSAAISMTKAAYVDCADMIEGIAARFECDLPGLLLQNGEENHRSLVLLTDGARLFAEVVAASIRQKAEAFELQFSTSEGCA